LPDKNALLTNRWFRVPFLLQIFVMLMLCLYGIITLLPGAISPRLRSGVMDRSANGYTIMKWADSVLPANAVLLNTHRSMALSPRDAISIDWASYVDPDKKEAVLYIKLVKEKKPSHIIITGPAPHDFGKFAACIGPVFMGPSYGRIATRNPLNKGELYEAWIYSFDASKLPDPTN
jgi:hypothetical protein